MKNSKYIIKHLVGTLVFFSVIFISAGSIQYWQGIVYLIIGVLIFIINYTILKPSSELLNERSKPSENTKNWDKIILGLTFLVTLSMYIIAGLDSGRYHWSPNFHWSIYLIGIILTLLGQLLFLIAQKQNKFFSSTVRIQANREHIVCETGLYKIIRHPAYLGSIIQAIGFPLLFGSFWCIIPVSILIILVLIRTIWEDNTLKNELKGYVEYSLKTPFKIIPFIW